MSLYSSMAHHEDSLYSQILRRDFTRHPGNSTCFFLNKEDEKCLGFFPLEMSAMMQMGKIPNHRSHYHTFSFCQVPFSSLSASNYMAATWRYHCNYPSSIYVINIALKKRMVIHHRTCKSKCDDSTVYSIRHMIGELISWGFGTTLSSKHSIGPTLSVFSK